MPRLRATSLGLLLVAETPRSGAELRLFEPATGSARLVSDLAPGPAWSDPSDLLWDEARRALLFTADDGTHGREPWLWEAGPPEP